MSKKRIYELARDLGLESKDVLTRAQELGLEVKTASSGLDEDEAGLVRLSFQEDSTDGTTAVQDDADGSVDDTAAPEEPSAEEAPSDADEAPAGADDVPTDDEGRALSSGGLELLDVPYGVTVADLATLMRRPTGALVKAIMAMGEMAAAAQPVPEHILHPLTEAFGFLITVGEPEVEVEAEVVSLRALVHEEDSPDDLAPRPPVITVMGHVDHGKTQLLDTIRNANVVAGEAGGITQHIGAYQVTTDAGKLTFIDTPGHEAFTSLRARGANVTDIVILVVAANDGVKPQTAEAINHAKAAGVPMIVAVNKMDLPEADPYAVRAQLTEHEIVVEELGGDVVNAEVSALTGDGVDGLLELVQLTAELEDLKSNPTANPEGVVIESNLDKGRGPVATVIVQRGTLRVGDVLVAGAVAGRVRAMIDDTGSQVKEAGPSTPVLIMGWSDVPSAGDRFEVAPDDKTARSIAADALVELRAKNLVVPTPQERMTTLLEEMRTADDAELRLIIKTDVTGSLEAIRDKVSEIGREGGEADDCLRRGGRHHRERRASGRCLESGHIRVQRPT